MSVSGDAEGAKREGSDHARKLGENVEIETQLGGNSTAKLDAL